MPSVVVFCAFAARDVRSRHDRFISCVYLYICIYLYTHLRILCVCVCVCMICMTCIRITHTTTHTQTHTHTTTSGIWLVCRAWCTRQARSIPVVCIYTHAHTHTNAHTQTHTPIHTIRYGILRTCCGWCTRQARSIRIMAGFVNTLWRLMTSHRSSTTAAPKSMRRPFAATTRRVAVYIRVHTHR